jgi:hypothetical protein
VRRAGLAALAVLALLLAGCSEIPTTGTVQKGSTEGPNNTTIVYLPNKPAPGAGVRDIVNGFVLAAAAGGDFRVAKEYLSTSFAAKWKPRAGVLITESQSAMNVTGSSDVTLRVPVAARLDASGVYRPDSGTVSLPFHLTQQSGQWRIDRAPDGIVVGDAVFQHIFHPASLEFFDPTWKRLVPDVRWFPVRPNVESGNPKRADIVDALLHGPAGPLAGSVVANALRGAKKVSVEVGSNDVTTVELQVPGSAPSPTVTGRMQQQLVQSLAPSTPSALRLVVNGRVAPEVRLLSNQPGSLNPYVIRGGRFGTLASNGNFVEESTLGKRIVAARPTAVTVSLGQKLAAVLTRSQEVALVTPTGPSRVVDSRSGLRPPTVDQLGWVYSVPEDGAGGLLASHVGRPSIAVSGPLGGDSITSIEVSPDGTRLLVLSESGKGPQAFVAGIERGADGAPTGLTNAQYTVDIGGRSGQGIGATWVDDASVATLVSSSDNDRVTVQQLGGVALPFGQLASATSIVGTSSTADLRVRLKNGDLWTWTSTVTSNLWQSESSSPVDVSVLAVQR